MTRAVPRHSISMMTPCLTDLALPMIMMPVMTVTRVTSRTHRRRRRTHEKHGALALAKAHRMEAQSHQVVLDLPVIHSASLSTPS